MVRVVQEVQMTEAVMEFIKNYIPQMIGVGFAFGSIMSVIVILTSYVINKVQSLVNDK